MISLWLSLLNKKYFPVFFFGGLSFLIMVPLLKSGYLLSLDTIDMLLGPDKYQASLFGHIPNGRLPFYLIANFVNFALPEWATQKLFWFFAFIIAGLGAYRLCPTEAKLGKYYAGLLYMINPFIYARLLAGQFFLVLSYAFIPLAVYYFISLLENRDKKSLILTTFFTTIVVSLEAHIVFLVFIAFVVLITAKIIQNRADKSYLFDISRRAGLLAVALFLLNAYWIVPLLTSEVVLLANISPADLDYFAPIDNTGLRVGLSVLSLHGFWLGGYLYTKDILDIWWLVMSFIFLSALSGLVDGFRDKEQGIYIKGLAVIGTIGLILALGTSIAATKPLFIALFDNIPFFKALRDSNKFVALLCLSYSFLGGWKVGDMASQAGRMKKGIARNGIIVLLVLALSLPLIYSFTIFNGFWGQVRPTDYPEEYYEVNAYLNDDNDDFNVLWLPWHAYMDYKWNPQRIKKIGTFGRHILDKPVIQGDNIEAGNIYTQSANPVSSYIEFLLKNKGVIDNLGELLAPLNVKYIVLLTEADYESYDFLYRQRDLTIEMEQPGIILFRNESPTSRIYGVDNVVYIESLEEYLELSRTQDVRQHLYAFGSGPGNNGTASTIALSFSESSLARYSVSGTPLRYTIFSLPQNMSTNDWQYNDTGPALKNLGFIPSFISSAEAGELVYTRFYRVYLPSYITSLSIMVFMSGYYFYPGLRKALGRGGVKPVAAKRARG